MKKVAKIFTIIFVILAVCALSIGLVACNNNDDYTARYEGQVIRFTAPEGTPALAMLRLFTDNPKLDGTDMEYEVVTASTIQVEMSNNNSDIVIMPVNAGAKLISQGKDYKLVSIAVEGSLFMVGNKDGGNTITFDDIKGKKVACIGQNNVPGLAFEYVLKSKGIEIIYSGEPTSNQVFIQYVSDATVARTAFVNGSVEYMVVGEPAATTFKSALGLNAEMDIQEQYSLANPSVNGENYPQAGLFVRSALAKDTKFMNALFDALAASKEWALAHTSEITAYAQENMYASANFPAGSIARCAISCVRLDDSAKNQIVAFLKYIMPSDANGNPIDWDAAKSVLF